MGDITLWQGDCLDLMKDIPDKSIDMVFMRFTVWEDGV